MTLPRADAGAPSGSPFSAWRVLTWVLLLLAVFGVFEYCLHAWHVATALRAAGGKDPGGLAGMLAWDIAYLGGACIILAVSAGALLRRGWARPVLRIVAVALALWLLASAIVLAVHLADFDRYGRALLARPGAAEAARAMLAHARRSYLVAIVFKAVGVPLLGWLAWRLGAPAVRAQFQGSPAAASR